MIIILLLIFGLVIGSFINALVWRLQHGRDWVRERSECTHCSHKLSSADLIPVASWLLLKGKCRYCHKKIDDSPVTELGLGLAYAGSLFAWPFALISTAHWGLFGLWLVILTVFAVLSLYDFKLFLLPDKFTYALIPLAFLFALLRSTVDPGFTIFEALLGSLAGFGFFWVLYQISKGAWIGGGDVKLGIAAGLLAGSFWAGLGVIFLSSLLGTLYALPLIVRQKRITNIKVPYGPFIMLATVILVLYYDIFNNLLFSSFSLPY